MLNKLTTYRKQSEQGFTLIELLVVIIIIGVLAAIAIPVYLNQQKTAHDVALKSDIKNTAILVETWFTKHPQKMSLTDAPTNEGTIQGWSLVARGENSPDFSQQKDTITPKGMTPPAVSEGTALGVASSSRWNQGFCVYGYNSFSHYDASSLEKAYFYDSLDGGLMSREELSKNGACAHYRMPD